MVTILQGAFDPAVIETLTQVGQAITEGTCLSGKKKNPLNKQVANSKKIVSILNIGSGAALGLKFISSNLLSAIKCIFLSVSISFLTLFGGLCSSISSIIDTIGIVSKIKSLENRVKIELDHALETNNYIKIREITLFTLSKWINLTKNFFILTTSLATIVALFAGVTIFSPALITFIALNFILTITSFLILKLGKINKIEKKYFG